MKNLKVWKCEGTIFSFDSVESTLVMKYRASHLEKKVGNNSCETEVCGAHRRHLLRGYKEIDRIQNLVLNKNECNRYFNDMYFLISYNKNRDKKFSLWLYQNVKLFVGRCRHDMNKLMRPSSCCKFRRIYNETASLFLCAV